MDKQLINKDINNQPPYSNTGVENTNTDELNALVDWLSITFKKQQDPEDIISFLGLDFESFIETRSGFHGYKEGYQFDNIRVYYDGSKSMGVHVVLSGDACRQYADAVFTDDHGWKEFFHDVLKMDVNISRLDLALDDYQKRLNFNTLKNKIKAGHTTSKFKTSREYIENRLSDGSEVGQTLYFGNRSSAVMFRFYDKMAEAISRGDDIPKGVDSWQRYEIELKKDHALKTARIISQGESELGDYIKGILGSYITFRVPSKYDDNKSRWKVSPFWSKFLGDVEKLRITEIAPKATIERTKKWLETQVFGSLAMFSQIIDDEPLFWWYVQEKGLESLSDEKKEYIKQVSIDHQYVNKLRKDLLESIDSDAILFDPAEHNKAGAKKYRRAMDVRFNNMVRAEYGDLRTYIEDSPFG